MEKRVGCRVVVMVICVVESDSAPVDSASTEDPTTVEVKVRITVRRLVVVIVDAGTSAET